MITKSPTSTHICLRCQLRISQSLHIRPRALARNRAREQHTKAAAGFQDKEDAHFTTKHIDSSVEQAGLFRIQRGTKYGINRPVKPLKALGRQHDAAKLGGRGVTEFPVGKIHGLKEHALRENVQELDITSLGKPAEVIVLRQAGIRYSYSRPEIVKSDSVKPVDILEILDAERGLADRAEVLANIEELRPVEKLLSWEAFKSTEENLNDGFTTTQLANYVATYSVANVSEARDSESKLSGGSSGTSEKHQSRRSGTHIRSPTVKVTSWMPGVSETGALFVENSVRGYVSDIAFTQKQRLVVLLMRQCWQLEVEEVVRSVGELEIQVQSQELELLISGKRTPLLGRISARSSLMDDEQVEVFRSRHAIRITARKENALSIAENIQEALNNVRKLDLDLETLSPPELSSNTSSSLKHHKKNIKSSLNVSVLDALSNLTGAQVNLLADNKLAITCIDAKLSNHLSTANDVVRRLLLTSMNFKDPTLKHLAVKGVNNPFMAVKYEQIDALSWRERLLSWSRWVVGTHKAEEKEVCSPDNTPTAISGSELNVQLSDRKLPAPAVVTENHVDETTPPSHGHWETASLMTTSAVLGHVLHQTPASDTTTVFPTNGSMKHKVTFAPASQNLSRLLGFDKRSSKMKPTASLRMRFLPNPWHVDNQRNAEMQPPPVEMRFRIDTSTKDVELKDVLAITNSSTSDFMLPDRALDLRFRQRTSCRLLMMHDTQLPQVASFIEASQLSLTRGSLVTPPSLILPIAPHICNIKREGSSVSSGSMDVEYLFAGLEYRTTFATSFKGWTLLYTSIEGGKADGRRSELSLRPEISADFEPTHRPELSLERSQEELSRLFVDDAFTLVDALENPDIEMKMDGNNIPKLKSIHKLNDARSDAHLTAREFWKFQEKTMFRMAGVAPSKHWQGSD